MAKTLVYTTTGQPVKPGDRIDWTEPAGCTVAEVVPLEALKFPGDVWVEVPGTGRWIHDCSDIGAEWREG